MDGRKRSSQYKKRSSFAEKREELKRRKSVERKQARDENLMLRRNLSPVKEDVTTVEDSRRLKLKKYKEEKARRKLLEKENAKPVFKVHWKIKYDYPVSDNMFSIINPKKVANSVKPSGADRLRPRTTAKTTSKNEKVTKSFAPKNFVFSAVKPFSTVAVPTKKSVQQNSKQYSQNQNSSKPGTIPEGNCRVLRSGRRLMQTEIKFPEKQGKDKKLSCKHIDLKKSPNKQKDLLNSIYNEIQEININKVMDIPPPASCSIKSSPVLNVNEETDNFKTPQCSSTRLKLRSSLQSSVNITFSRGSSSKKKGNKIKLENSNQPQITDVNQFDLAGEQENLDVSYFKNLVSSHTIKLQRLNEKWKQYMESQSDISEEGLGSILSVTGQSQLVMDQRFRQFDGLIDCCEHKKGVKETTISDLAGFWEMIYLQVEDVYEKFSKLEKLSNNNWKEETPIKRKSQKQNKKRKSLKVKGNSELRNLIQNRRKMTLKNTSEDAIVEIRGCNENAEESAEISAVLSSEVDAENSIPDSKRTSLRNYSHKNVCEDLITFSPFTPIENRYPHRNSKSERVTRRSLRLLLQNQVDLL